MQINFKIGIQIWQKHDLSWKMVMFMQILKPIQEKNDNITFFHTLECYIQQKLLFQASNT